MRGIQSLIFTGACRLSQNRSHSSGLANSARRFSLIWGALGATERISVYMNQYWIKEVVILALECAYCNLAHGRRKNVGPLDGPSSEAVTLKLLRGITLVYLWSRLLPGAQSPLSPRCRHSHQFLRRKINSNSRSTLPSLLFGNGDE